MWRREFSGTEELDRLNAEFQSVQDRMDEVAEKTAEYRALSVRYAELIREGEALTALRIRMSGEFD